MIPVERDCHKTDSCGTKLTQKWLTYGKHYQKRCFLFRIYKIALLLKSQKESHGNNLQNILKKFYEPILAPLIIGVVHIQEYRYISWYGWNIFSKKHFNNFQTQPPYIHLTCQPKKQHKKELTPLETPFCFSCLVKHFVQKKTREEQKHISAIFSSHLHTFCCCNCIDFQKWY